MSIAEVLGRGTRRLLHKSCCEAMTTELMQLGHLRLEREDAPTSSKNNVIKKAPQRRTILFHVCRAKTPCRIFLASTTCQPDSTLDLEPLFLSYLRTETLSICYFTPRLKIVILCSFPFKMTFVRIETMRAELKARMTFSEHLN